MTTNGIEGETMQRTFRVAILIETSREYGRGILRGISRFQKDNDPWSIYFQPRGTTDPIPSWLPSWQGDGILARVEDRQMADALLATGIPTIDLRFAVPNLEMPAVGIDETSLVRLAVDHFLERGFRRFAFCGSPPGQFIWMDRRKQLFCEMVAEAGFACETYELSSDLQTIRWEEDQQDLIRWIQRLRKPVAIMACNDDRGLQLLDACRQAGFEVPNEVSVLGVDNDEFSCGLSTPPLSSIDMNLEKVGYTAAQLLQSMMEGTPPPTENILFPAKTIVARRSTDYFAFEDKELVAALRYLNENACKGVTMKDVIEATGIERRTLERRMRTILGRSPKDEITRIQIDHSKGLLERTDLPLDEVAKQTGFSNSRYFSRVFGQRVGMTPVAFRKNALSNDLAIPKAQAS
ncbi:MAG: DNA-binding transcriptional regulator [Pirellulaceae bacterium]